MFGFSVRSGVLAVAGTLAATSLLSGCGGQVKMGAAATFANDRITIASLDDTVNRWTKEYAATPQADQVRQQIEAQFQSQQQGTLDVSSPPRLALRQLVEFRVLDEAAKQRNVDVTPGQVDAFVSNNGGRNALDLTTLAFGLPRSESLALARYFLLQRRLLVDPALGQPTQASANAYEATHVQAAKALKVDVNPRYGTFDAAKGFGPVNYTLTQIPSGTNGD